MKKVMSTYLGSGTEISIKDLVQTIATHTGFTGQILWDPTKPNGQPRRRLDTERAKKTFGFQAQTDLETGVAQTTAWYRSHKALMAE